MLIVLAEAKNKRREIKEVRFEGGVAGASSRLYNDRSGPENAFMRNDQSWMSGKNASGEGKYVFFPHLIWYEFKTGNAPVPAEISFTAVKFAHGPTKWQFVGSMDKGCDENSAWAVICEDLSGERFDSDNIYKSCKTEKKFYFEFLCFGIRVLAAPFDKDKYERWHYTEPIAMISNIRIWEQVMPFPSG